MKAARWHGRLDVRVEDVPDPEALIANHVRVKVRWCGICCSDLHEYTAGPILVPSDKPHPVTGKVAPIIMGHEFSGDIVAVGSEVTSFHIGDRVTALGLKCWCHRKVSWAVGLDGFAALNGRSAPRSLPGTGEYGLPPGPVAP